MLGPILSIVGHAVVDVIVTVITHEQKEVIYMAGRKDNVVVAVIGDLTASQAAELQKQIVVAKGRYAPNGRGRIATGTRENVGVLIQSGCTSSKRIAKNAQKVRYCMFYDLMNTGDRVLTITNEFLAIERCDGSVDLYPVISSKSKITLDINSVTTIGYSPCSDDTETDEYTTENDVHIVNFQKKGDDLNG